MILARYKKILAIIAIIAIFAPGFFLFSVKKTEAVVGQAAGVAGLASVPTVDTYQYVKKGWLDGIAWMLAKAVLRQITNSTVKWIQTGFKGNPAFITDFGGFMKESADQATGLFMAEYLNPDFYKMICSPFRLQLMLSLPFYRPYKPWCTLNTVLAVQGQSFESFSKGFKNGGWQAWISMTGNSNNNYYGAFFTSWDTYLARLAAGQNKSQTESIFGKGFLGMKKCVEYIDGPMGEQICSKEVTTSPGAWVSDQLSAVTQTDLRSLEIADEINEILSALVTQLVSYALTSGAGSGGIANSTSLPPQDTTPVRNDLIARIDAVLIPTTQIWSDSTSTIAVLRSATSTYSQAENCFSASDQSQKATEMSNTIQKINNEDIPPVKKLFSDAQGLKSGIETLKEQVPPANSSGFLETVQTSHAEIGTYENNLSQLQLDQFNAIKPTDAQKKLDDAKEQLKSCQGTI